MWSASVEMRTYVDKYVSNDLTMSRDWLTKHEPDSRSVSHWRHTLIITRLGSNCFISVGVEEEEYLWSKLFSWSVSSVTSNNICSNADIQLYIILYTLLNIHNIHDTGTTRSSHKLYTLTNFMLNLEIFSRKQIQVSYPTVNLRSFVHWNMRWFQ